MGDQPTLNFGSDMNSTPLSTLNLAPTVTSRGDAAPVSPPVYNPTIDVPQHHQGPPPASTPHRRVTFDLPQEHRRKKEKKRPRYEYYAPPPPTPPPPPPPQSTKRLFVFLHTYSRHITVFVLVAVLLWYYASLARVPYLGTGQGLTTFGIAGAALGASLGYGGIDYLLS
jgi:hypothetical protein